MKTCNALFEMVLDITAGSVLNADAALLTLENAGVCVQFGQNPTFVDEFELFFVPLRFESDSFPKSSAFGIITRSVLYYSPISVLNRRLKTNCYFIPDDITSVKSLPSIDLPVNSYSGFTRLGLSSPQIALASGPILLNLHPRASSRIPAPYRHVYRAPSCAPTHNI